MHVAAEDRVKSNEVVLSRHDLSVVVLYVPGPSLLETRVVLVREFRSPASTPDGFVHELPGGSGPGGPLEQAVAEVAEETGLLLGRDRLRPHGSRQLAATMSAHHAHLFSAELSPAELELLRPCEDGTERTYPEIVTYGELLEGRLADWTTVGMVAQVLTG
jgi:8-oxo-dGTP pyrophosphatase MutT (NUDIX family)